MERNENQRKGDLSDLAIATAGIIILTAGIFGPPIYYLFYSSQEKTNHSQQYTAPQPTTRPYEIQK